MSLQYLKKEARHEVRHEIFYKLSFLMEVGRHVQSTQNWKLVIFLQSLKKRVCFLHADKYESFLQDDTNILGVFGQT